MIHCLLVVLGKLLLVIQLILIHLFEFVGPAALLFQFCKQPIDAGLGIIGAVLAFVLVDHVLTLQHVSEGGYF